MMMYIKALELVNLALENGILHEVDGKIPVYMHFEDREDGFYLVDKEYAVQSLMRSEEGQSIIMSKLSDNGINFEPKYIEQ